ncbi:MBOAT family O-acyltransferase, partial [Enterococcus casseliflavus]
YSMQLFFDFSGYSAMAIGLGLMLGFHFPENFNHPYLAGSIQDFWRRWHISLSSWLRDYLYIGLGGNRHGVWKTYRNLFLTMAIAGLWH